MLYDAKLLNPIHHFYQVLKIMTERDVKYQSISAGRYAKGLFSHVS
ncbi:MAG: tRNA isopentenyl-2-thiomethyl-A-37 hydroxylase MiaE [Candidatus Phlomobacter fragariae]